MKKITSTLFPFLMSLMLVFAVGCDKSSNDDAEGDVPTDEYNYSVGFQLPSFSDTYFDFGTLTLKYLDSDGQIKSVDVTKDLIPGEIVVVEGLGSGAYYYFELCFEPLETLPSLTEEVYEFFITHTVSVYSNGLEVYPLENTTTSSVSAEKIEEYLDAIASLVEVSGNILY